MNDNGRPNGRLMLPMPFIEKFGVSIGTLVLIVAQTVAVVGWLVNDHAQINHLIEEDGRLLQRVDSLDTTGTRFGTQFIPRILNLDAEVLVASRQIDALSKRIDDVRSTEQSDEIMASRLQAEIDLLKQENSRIEEQQTRILQALDNTYNLLQEHLRAHQGATEKGPPPLRLKPPRD